MRVPSREPVPVPLRTLLAYRVTIAVLAVIVAVMGVLLVRMDARIERMVTRVADLEVASDLNLVVDPGLLLLVTAEDAEFRIGDLARMQRRAGKWLDGYCREHDIGEVTCKLMHSVLARHLTDYGNTRIQLALGGIPPDEVASTFEKLHRRYYRVLQPLVRPSLREDLRREIANRWYDWMELSEPAVSSDEAADSPSTVGAG